MNIVFLGTGESTDPSNPNTSILIEGKTKLLLDCGFSVPMQLWNYNDDPDLLDGVFVSHQHGDHILGLPGLLLQMWQTGRKKPLTIFASQDMQRIIATLMGIHYRAVIEKPTFSILFATPAKPKTLGPLELSFAPSIHSVENYAIRIAVEKKSVCYSGDGMFSDATVALYERTDLLIHETYTLNKKVDCHASLVNLVSLFEAAHIKRLAAVHVQKNQDKKTMAAFIKKTKLPIFLPKPMEQLRV